MTDESRIAVACEACGKRLKVKAIAAGRRVSCPKCNAPIQIPSPAPEPIDILSALGDEAANPQFESEDFRLSDLNPRSTTNEWSPPPEPIRSPAETFIPPKPYAPVRPEQPDNANPTRRAFPMLRLVMTLYRVLAGVVALSWAVMTIIIIGMLFTGAFATANAPGGAILAAFVSWFFVSFIHVVQIAVFL